MKYRKAVRKLGMRYYQGNQFEPVCSKLSIAFKLKVSKHRFSRTNRRNLHKKLLVQNTWRHPSPEFLDETFSLLLLIHLVCIWKLIIKSEKKNDAAYLANINVKWLNLWIINDFFKNRPAVGYGALARKLPVCGKQPSKARMWSAWNRPDSKASECGSIVFVLQRL